MLTVLDSINLSTSFLKEKGIDSPRINAELLLAHILNCKRLDLYLAFDRPLKEDEIKLYRDFIKRRSKYEPLQYILGKVEFYGLEFNINPSVLIPRQETEILVETVIDTLDKNISYNILDIGTGSGILAVCLAKYLPNSNITAIDVNNDALNTAVQNAVNNKVVQRINFQNLNIMTNFEYDEHKYDVIVSNPPYISSDEFPSLQPELKAYEPRIALTDEGDGLEFFRIISTKAAQMLRKPGKLFFELGKDQHTEVKAILYKNNFKNIFVKKDYLNIERVISGELI